MDTRRVIDAAALAAATAAYYATPDLIRSRGARALVKTGIVAGAAALTGAAVARDRGDAVEPAETGEAVRERVTRDADGAEHVDLIAQATPAQLWGELPAQARTAVAVAGAGALALGLAVTVVGEKWIFGRGEARRAAGQALAHTRVAVPLGLAAGAFTLLEPPRR